MPAIEWVPAVVLETPEGPKTVYRARRADAAPQGVSHLKQSKGERVGTLPFGYRVAADGVHLQADPDEHQILTRMRTLRAAGVTLRGIAADLNREGFTTRRGTPWRFEYVARALQTVADSDQLASAP